MCGLERRFLGGVPGMPPHKRKAPTRGWGAECVGALYVRWPPQPSHRRTKRLTCGQSVSFRPNLKIFRGRRIFRIPLTVRWNSAQADVDLGVRPKIFQKLTHLFLWHRHAPGGGGQGRLGEMQEYRAAAAGYPRACVVVDFDNEIIEMILPPEPVAGLTGRHLDRPVVAAVGGVLAPGVGARDASDRQHGGRPRMAVSAPPEPNRAERAARGAAVALPLVRQNAASPERNRPGDLTRP